MFYHNRADKRFHDAVEVGPIFICSSCDQLLYHHSVHKAVTLWSLNLCHNDTVLLVLTVMSIFVTHATNTYDKTKSLHVHLLTTFTFLLFLHIFQFWMLQSGGFCHHVLHSCRFLKVELVDSFVFIVVLSASQQMFLLLLGKNWVTTRYSCCQT